VRSRKPPLDRFALLAACLLLPACVSTRPAEIGRGRDLAPAMPPIQITRSDQTTEPPLAADVVVSARPAEPGPLAILPVKGQAPAGDGVRTAGLEEPAEDSTSVWATADAKPTEPPLVAALRCYLNKSPEQAARWLQGMDQADRDLLAALLPLAVRLGDGALKSADPQDLAALVDDVQSLVAPLRERAALEVPKLCFCRPVAAPARFGVYEVLEENHLFRPGDLVGLYVEVRNFACAPHGDDYRTYVKTSVEVHNARGQIVWRFDPPARTDPSLSPRQDYCHFGRFALPPDLPPGAYTLWLKVTDVPTGRTAKRSLDFRVTTISGREGEKEQR
jgi:hypothetical protein